MTSASLTHPRPSAIAPDLLDAHARVRIDAVAMREALVFAFAMGSSLDAFDQHLATASLPTSAWNRAGFVRDLYLEQLLEGPLRIRIDGRAFTACKGYLLRAIAEPPRDRAVVDFRRAVLSELASSKAMRAEAESIYRSLVQLRAMLCATAQRAHGLRRLEILRAVHALFAQLAASFEGASSGLRRVRAFGQAAVTSAAYRRLDALLDHEGHLGTVDLRVRVGAEGDVRAFQVVAVRENRSNPFHTSPIGRLLARLMLFLRGYRLQGGEVLERLYEDVFAGLEDSLILCFQLLGDLEFHLAGLSFRDCAESKGLSVCFPELFEDGATQPCARVRGLFNPLLLAAKHAPTPCDLEPSLAQAGCVVIVTGPNSGGKTRLLQAIALAQMLAESGLFAPARSAQLPRASGLFVSLLDEARADQPEGHLGMELMRIRRMFEELEVGSLVLLDELCAGTNPSEGEEIARLVISLLPELDARVFISTHLLEFAARLQRERPIAHLEFLQVELDAREAPTYRFVPGVARTSLAHKTAARLGVTRDELEALIESKRRARASPDSSDPTSDPADAGAANDAEAEAASAPITTH